MNQVSKKRQQISKQIRQNIRKQYFASKRSKFIINQQKIMPNLINNICNYSIDRDQYLQIIKIIPNYVTKLSYQQLKVILKICYQCLISSTLIAQVTNILVEISNLKFNNMELKQYLSQYILVEIVKILRSTDNIEIILNCIYFYQNIAVQQASIGSLTQQTIAILRKLWQKYPKHTDIWQTLLWVIRNSILILIKDNSIQKLQKSKFGQNMIYILNEITIKSLKIEKQQQSQNNRALLYNNFELYQLIISHQFYQNQLCLYRFNQILQKQQLLLQDYKILKDSAIMGQVVEISILMIHKIGLTQGISQIVLGVAQAKINAHKGLTLCALLNQIGATKLSQKQHSFQNMEIFLRQMNRIILQTFPIFLNNPILICLEVGRKSIVRYLLSQINILPKLNPRQLLNLVFETLLDKSDINISEGLQILSIFIENHNQQEALEMIEDCGILQRLLQLQMHPISNVYEQATNILQILNFQS